MALNFTQQQTSMKQNPYQQLMEKAIYQIKLDQESIYLNNFQTHLFQLQYPKPIKVMQSICTQIYPQEEFINPTSEETIMYSGMRSHCFVKLQSNYYPIKQSADDRQCYRSLMCFKNLDEVRRLYKDISSGSYESMDEKNVPKEEHMSELNVQLCLQTVKKCQPKSLKDALTYVGWYMKKIKITKQEFKDVMQTLLSTKMYIYRQTGKLQQSYTKDEAPLEQINEHLPLAFCPICMLFLCTKHLDANQETNTWIFQRINQTLKLNFDLNMLKREKSAKHLKEWIFNVENVCDARKNVKNYRCQSELNDCIQAILNPQQLKSFLKFQQVPKQSNKKQNTQAKLNQVNNQLEALSNIPYPEKLVNNFDFIIKTFQTLNPCFLKLLYNKFNNKKYKCNQISGIIEHIKGTYQNCVDAEDLLIQPKIKITMQDINRVCDMQFYEQKLKYQTKPQNDGIPHYSPCDHQGACTSDCSCIQSGLLCESWCCCKNYCLNAFPGCSCKGEKDCENKNKCLCLKYNRECDPNKCRGCRSYVTHNANANYQHTQAMLQGKLSVNKVGGQMQQQSLARLCKNVPLTLNFPCKRVFTAKSTLCDEIVGLFTMDRVKKDELIMEYTGKVITQEGQKETVDQLVNDLRGRSYGFTLDRLTTLDAVYVGNLMRFANHSSDKLSNCKINMIFAQGMQRVCLVASRNIDQGEELFFDYGFSKEFEWLKDYDRKYNNKLCTELTL